MALLEGMPAEEFVNYFIVDATPALFESDRHGYHEWRRHLARALDVDPAGLHIVGSACLGFSADPSNSLRDFLPTSDIDVAVISAYHFDVAWRELRRLRRNLIGLPPEVATSIRKFSANDVFEACIATDKVLGALPFADAWLRGASIAAQSDEADGRAVNFRLYRDLEGLRSYQQRSVERLQDGMIANE